MSLTNKRTKGINMKARIYTGNLTNLVCFGFLDRTIVADAKSAKVLFKYDKKLGVCFPSHQKDFKTLEENFRNVPLLELLEFGGEFAEEALCCLEFYVGHKYQEGW